MPLTLTDLRAHFKTFGKLIYLDGLVDTVSGSIRKAHMGAVDQQATGEASDFTIHQTVIVPLGAVVLKATAALAKVADATKSAADNYVRKHLAVDLGVSANAATASIQAAVTSQFAACDPPATFVPDGQFVTYFSDKLGINLPEAANVGAATVPDTYIDDDVI